MSAEAVLVSVTGDGTLRSGSRRTGRDPERAAAGPQSLMHLRSLLGEGPEEQIGTRAYLPAAGGTEPADHLLPATLSLLAGTAGDLTSYGWRLGTGAGLAWHRARELRERTLEDARIAFLGHEGPLCVTALGPLTLAAATHLASGERSLADRGAVRDLPVLLGEGLAAQLAAARDRVPGAVPAVLVREDAAAAVHEGRLATPSGYRRYPGLSAPEMGARWQDLREVLGAAGVPRDVLTLAVVPDPQLLAAARAAGWRRLAIAPGGAPGLGEATGRRAWEQLAEAHADGVALELVVDPARIDQELEAFVSPWRQLGHGEADLRGLTLLAHPRSSARGTDPSAEPGAQTLLDPSGLERVLRAAPAWAEGVSG